eukprot:gene4026-4403_t
MTALQMSNFDDFNVDYDFFTSAPLPASDKESEIALLNTLSTEETDDVLSSISSSQSRKRHRLTVTDCAATIVSSKKVKFDGGDIQNQESANHSILLELGLNPATHHEVNLLPRPLPVRAWRRAYLIPRIPKKDFRRFFPQMLANVINTADAKQIRDFIMTFHSSSCRSVDFIKREKAVETLVPLKETNSSSSLASFICEFVSSTPDVVFVVQESSLKQFLNRGGTEITVSSMIRGTIIKDMMTEVKDEKGETKVVPIHIYNALLKGRGLLRDLPLSEAIASLTRSDDWTGLNLDYNPTLLDLNFSFTFHMDNNHLIYKTETVAS